MAGMIGKQKPSIVGRDTLSPYKPSATERIPMMMQDALMRFGMSPQTAGKYAQKGADVLDWTPIGGAAQAWDAGANAARQPGALGKIAGLGEGVLLAAMTAAPFVKKGVKAANPRLAEISSYNEAIRKKTGPVTLDRNPFFESNIPYQQDNFYRLVGRDGLKDFEQAGVVRAKQDSKMAYNHAYYETGRANSIYAKNGGGDVAIEVSPDLARFENVNVPGSYPRTRVGQEVTPADAVRIWERNPNTGLHEIAFDNINDAISYAAKYGGKPRRSAAGGFLVVGSGGARSEIANKQAEY